MGSGSRDTERLRLRDLRLSDEEALTAAWVNAHVARFMDDYGPRTADEVRRWLGEAIEATRRDPSAFGWAIELKHTGQVSARPNWDANGGIPRHAVHEFHRPSEPSEAPC